MLQHRQQKNCCCQLPTHTHTHMHPFNGPLSGTTRVNRYQKGKTSLDFTEARDSEWQWHPLGHMQVCTSLQTDNHASTPPPFLSPNEQCQSTEGTASYQIRLKISTTCRIFPIFLKRPGDIQYTLCPRKNVHLFISWITLSKINRS